MQLSNYLGLKLVDIGVDTETNTLWLEFTGGHKIHIKRDDIGQSIILAKPNISSSELEDRREEIKKARAEARAIKAAKAPDSPAKKASKKASKKTES
jgi:hypothetical protein